MKYRVVLKRLLDGQYYARCNAAPLGVAEVTSPTADEALETMKKEIRYQLEWCPCSGIAEDFVELEVRNGPR